MKYDLVIKELNQLKTENEHLKRLLSNMMHRREEKAEITNNANIISNRALPIYKINLFKSLFKGRTDVFAYRYESNNGKKCYTPAIYPLLQDDMCVFLAFDFDKQNWQQDLLAFVKECKNSHIPVNIERSRSGKGAHVWIFFFVKINQ
ncbi:hypothetical protein QNH39_14920 [Neobacillus novalis]|uniref:TOTE conflict system primase domain-containing protein n=1 Tax=Neobacillus novalis TaxID=220687 RepID=A0AA95MHP6_9BACI|nr:hypothetical protein [Neobacillus novalis]WHY83977.1 hypothetical protein QNH39_14920 [Neobacillus novalis]